MFYCGVRCHLVIEIKKTENISRHSYMALMKCYSSMFIPFLSHGDYDITLSFAVM